MALTSLGAESALGYYLAMYFSSDVSKNTLNLISYRSNSSILSVDTVSWLLLVVAF